jgi:hypothetical protein
MKTMGFKEWELALDRLLIDFRCEDNLNYDQGIVSIKANAANHKGLNSSSAVTINVIP